MWKIKQELSGSDPKWYECPIANRQYPVVSEAAEDDIGSGWYSGSHESDG